MAGSQLKRLKSSLREQGIIGPQKSKKQKKQAAEEARANGGSEKRLRKTAALETIREQFNPFQFKMNARGPKFPVTSLRTQKEGLRGIKGRPQVALSRSEEKRRSTLLVDMQRRNKVGGILDRRLGEGDPNMTPEERALERFAFEKQRTHSKKGAVFDLEDDGDDDVGLTHMGRSLAVGDDGEAAESDEGLRLVDHLRDDFDEDLSDGESDDDSEQDVRLKQLKRMRSEAALAESGGGTDEPERKKTKKEVMQEVIAKSKLHKYERQVTREADDDERAALDKMLPELQSLLLAPRAATTTTVGDKTMKLAGGLLADKVDKAALEKSYDVRLRELMQDKKAEPSTRTKTEEEVAAEQSAHLKKLEESRVKRMLGQVEFEEGGEGEEGEEGGGKTDKKDKQAKDDRPFSFPGQDDEDEFALGQGIRVRHTAAELGFDDEDDFLIDDDLVASGSDVEEADDSETVLESVPMTGLATAVQRIRALHHPKLEAGNKERLGRLAAALVVHVVYLGDQPSPSHHVIESLVRHVHSLAKMVPIDVAVAFRGELARMVSANRLTPGDLVLLAAVAMFPTSDHFHPVVTPAVLAMGRFLAQRPPRTAADCGAGLFVCTLLLQFQQRARRYVPELLTFVCGVAMALAPVPLSPAVRRRLHGQIPLHASAEALRVATDKAEPRRLRPADCQPDSLPSEALKSSLLATAVAVLEAATALWADKAAVAESLAPAIEILRHLAASPVGSLPASVRQAVTRALTTAEAVGAAAQLARRPLELHHHRPLAIRTLVPRFEDEFDPDKHYDPNRERAEAAKLQAELKRERKGALRELRKDAAFMAREQLKLKKTRDAAYEKKYKRLVAEIQGQEGHAANDWLS
ncbi:rRNA maturation protein [Grosmannia clavigera kw1407]|uniref:rRNA maturation protein n=1 Tax=Grosmannia clavigera (strain kw1407 / UAMH 11150) TaxID=655863 RepID=F0XR63_GROCL|nr:rRNA maturation protein [Grosmannia clavigera kw1407]EFW99913.1 rRNA maturation protein [Grosmannia clavigera kw1407]